MNVNALTAVFKRNFVSYFSSPTGYVFVCVFVLLSSFAAFWPHEFFNNNLANLDQLNIYFPYIMLVFIPAITMSIWAEERRLGTDELLLTIPATDVEIVIGKYLAAVAIYTVALVFSMFANLWVLVQLGKPDLGLFVATYLGYWFVGLAMLSIGMVASFLTGNLTVGFILGALFNAPLAFLSSVDAIVKNPSLAAAIKRWSVAAQFHDFQRGVLSLSSVCYFVMITVVMLYLSVVLIGRRHWLGGRDGRSMLGHYVVRTLALVGVAVGVSLLFSSHDGRADVTSEQLSSLSPETRKLIQGLDTKYPVTIEAYVSPQVPPEYVQTRLDLLSVLDELKSLGGGKVRIIPHVIENFSEEAVLAEEKYGIKPHQVMTKTRGAHTEESIFLAAAFTCGLDKVVLPFIDRGIPVEYELVRSIATVAQQKRKKLGVLKTDAQLLSSFNMQTMSPGSDSQLITELKKQYDVVEVDATKPIKEKYDVLLAVQPSSLSPEQMDNFIDVVKSGQPTAIFEDPFPLPTFFPNVPGTAQPKRPPQQNPFMMQQQPPQPKGDIERLWELLGVRMAGDEIIWQRYNPYPKGEGFITPEWVFVDDGNGAETPFDNANPITSKLQQILLIFPGAWQKRNTSELDFVKLATTGRVTGTIRYSDIMRASQMSRMSAAEMGLGNFEIPTGEEYVVAAQVHGARKSDKAKSTGLLEQGDTGAAKSAASGGDNDKAATQAEDKSAPNSDAKEKTSDATEKQTPESAVNVVLVSDIDCLASAFFFVRAQGEVEDAGISWNFDNVTFVLNILDELAGDERFIEIRKRRRQHRALVKLDEQTEQARQQATNERQVFMKEFNKTREDEQKKFDERIAGIEKRTDLDRRMKAINVEMARRDGQRRLDVRVAALQQERDRKIDSIDRNLALEVRKVQDWYKLLAVLIPPIPPLLLAFFVFFHRRQAEREGVDKSRFR
jgi:ABC-2 type transport system permease protein